MSWYTGAAREKLWLSLPMNTEPQPADFTYVLNGEPRSGRGPLSVAALLAEVAPNSSAVAVERNGHVVPRALHGETMLGPDDRVEVVTIVGGG